MSSKQIILLGFRGAGKSTVAELVGKALKLSPVELDARLTERAQMTLPDFIETHGEVLFRQWEAEELKRALAEPSAHFIVAGGGIVESSEAMDLLASTRAIKILLHCTPELLWDRLKTDPERLRVGRLQSLQDLKRLWEQRAAKYRSVATFSVDSSDLNRAADEVAGLMGRALS